MVERRPVVHNQVGEGTFWGPVVQAGSIDSVTITGSGGAAVPVDDAICNPASVYASVLGGRFTGREWLIGQIDDFLDRRRCGYVWIEADAGMGKSALAAHLVRERGWFSHFARYVKGGSIRLGLRNLAGQLIKHYELWDLAPGRTLPERAYTPEGFEQVLARAAEHAHQNGDRVVMVVDGADEAEQPRGMLPWGLPRLLPEGVFVVGTYRTGSPPGYSEAPRMVVRIDATDPHNQQDLITHLDLVAREESLAARLAGAGVSAEQFTHQIASRCRGVWVYLRYVLDEIRLGQRHAGDVADLPVDLSSYYISHLEAWNRDENWQDGLLPVLATLAVAGEPLTPDVLARLSSADERLVDRWCRGTLRPFLTATTTSPHRFEIYHTSLREVITGARPHTNAPEDERWSELLRTATITAHSRVAEHYLGMFGGLATSLSALAADPGLASRDDGYPLRHLAQHLLKAGRVADLHRLLRVERPASTDRAVNVWFAANNHADTVHGYQADLATARQDCERQTDHALAARRSAPGLCGELQYLLMEASSTSLTNNVPAELLIALLTKGMWSREQTMAHARRLATPTARAQVLTAGIEHAPHEHKMAVLAEAMAAARAIAHEPDRAEALTRLVPHVPAYQRSEALSEAMTAAQAITYKSGRAEALARLAPYLSADQLSWALTHTIANFAYGARALAGLAPHLSTAQLSRALTAAKAITYGATRAMALAGLVPHLAADQRPAALAQAGTDAMAAYEPHRAEALAMLAPHLAADQLSQAWNAATAITNEDARAEALAGLAPHLPANQRPAALSQALDAATAITYGFHRAEALARLAPHLAADQLSQAWNAATAITNEHARARALAGLTPHLPADQLSQALDAATAITYGPVGARALAGLVPHLPADQWPEARSQALAAARAITNELDRAEVLTALVPHLPADQRRAALSQALETALDITDEDEYGISTEFERDRILAGLVPHLAAADQLTEALDAALAITDKFERAEALAGLEPQLTYEQLSWVEADATTIALARHHAKGLAPRLTADQRTAVRIRALDDATAVTDAYAYAYEDWYEDEYEGEAEYEHRIEAEFESARWLAGMAPPVPGEQVSEALAAALSKASDRATKFTDPSARIKALAGLAPHLAADQRTAALIRALDTATAITRDVDRAHALAQVAPHLAADQLCHALTAVPYGYSTPLCSLMVRAGQVLDANLRTTYVSLLRAAFRLVDRETCLALLSACAPALQDLAGADFGPRVATTLREVHRWWA